MNSLEEIRDEIDEIDSELVRLFVRRMDCSRRVAAYKEKHHLPILNAEREQAVLKKVAGQAGDLADAARLLFSQMMDISRAEQMRRIASHSPLKDEVNAAVSRSFSPRSVACPGVDGAFSSAAARKLFPNAVIHFYDDFKEAVDAVSRGTDDTVVHPVENSFAGSVSENYDLIRMRNLKINAGINLPVTHCLIGLPGSSLSDIKRVFSHPQGLSQCAEFLESHGIVPMPYVNTATAAKHIAELKDPSAGAVCSREAAELYGCTVLKEGIQSSDLNSTRFVAASLSGVILPDADRISLCFSLPHVTGSLCRVLSQLAGFGLNLTKIESRPLRDSPFEYLFFLDCTGNLRNPSILELLSGMQNELPQFYLLGNYREIPSEK